MSQRPAILGTATTTTSRLLAVLATAIAVPTLGAATAAHAQACLGLPAAQGQMAFQGEVTTLATGERTAYGGRIGVNFDTEYSFEVGVRRPVTDYGRGMSAAGLIGYESEMYEPTLCGVFGVRYHETPTETGEEVTTLLPLGIGIGKRLGSANSFSLAIFIRPEYMYVLRPEPSGDYETFWDELGHRSEGRGAVGLLLGTPFIFASGTIEVATRDDLTPTVALALGVVF